MKRLEFGTVKPFQRPTVNEISGRRHIIKLLSCSALAACLAGPMVFPKMVRGQEPQTQAQTGVMQFSMKDAKKYVAEAERHRIVAAGYETYHAILSDSTEISLSFFASPDKPAEVGEAGSSILMGVVRGADCRGYRFSLDDFKTAYKEATGKELKYVRVGVETGEDPQVGNYAQFYIFPVQTKEGELSPGSQVIFMCNHAVKLTDPTAGKEPIYVASR